MLTSLVLHLTVDPSSIADPSFIVDPSSIDTTFIKLKSAADFMGFSRFRDGGLVGFHVITPQSDFDDYPMVSSLIDVDTRWWKVDMVRSIFLPFEASTILKIPLNYNLPEDSLIWIGNKRGVFYVKSAYHIALSFVDSNEEGECSSPDPRTALWKRIWRLKIPQKLKIFTWRSCVNGLPTMLNLSQRGIHCSGFCPICDKALESTAHALLLCDHAKLTWAHWLNCPFEITSSPRDLVDVALDFNENGSPLDLELFFALAWSIWWNRNQATHENSGINLDQVWERANRLLSEYKNACSLPTLSLAPSPSAWQVPPLGVFKINTDGAASDGYPSCIGVAIRDYRGSLLAASSKILAAPFSAEITEALVLQEGVLLALDLGISHAIIESDALSIIQAITDGVLGGVVGHIVQNIKDLSSSFSWCSFQL
ncbi:hypothetical protein SO802_034082 [Lithocarpus litseifolius]|uniref:Reverse transcriptase zinc-binding domain-containing protein n=1 Tax=Lithocarpus litseifolius TaxID=425828 RepID=A0AAW2BH58_9ROSI